MTTPNQTTNESTQTVSTEEVQTTQNIANTNYSRNIDDTRIVSTNNVNPYLNNNTQTTPNQTQNILGGFDTSSFVKGALIGAAATYLLTNENVQKNIFKLFAKGSSMLQAGMEEMKERMEDAKAELEDEQI